ncbi:MAG: Ig-like domain-containing protein [Candidatus Taylorbacteria bacterium]|nr:Ig-like domain-containing protein [Candidatus Taylorbacteria bacterium]
MLVNSHKFKILIPLIIFLILFAYTGLDNSYVSAQTGGTITNSGGYTIHSFGYPGGTFNPGPYITSVEYLVVAGGGGGGTVAPCCNGPHTGGGGGAGGLLTGTAGVANTDYLITVGAGGNAGAYGNGANGGSSIFGSYTAIGGGGGAGVDGPGLNGGSGGGGWAWNGGVGGGSGTAGQGNVGGDGGGYNNLRTVGGGGGGRGGSGGAGNRDFAPFGLGGNGGPGFASSIYDGTSIMFAGGGGGAAGDNWNNGTGGVGGAGGGGNAPGGPGADFRGGGGGGNGGNGGSGVVIIRYLNVPTVNNVTISSSTIIPDNSTQYNIVVTGTNSTGGTNITHEYALINYQGANAPNYRGYLTWYYDSAYTGWDGLKDKRTCTGGGVAAIQSGYGDTYLRMDACSTSISGTVRATTFTVRFDPSFTTPLTNNDISGYVHNIAGNNTGWVNFDINFAVYTGPSVSMTAPAVNSNLRGTSVTVSADASGLPAIAGVQFLLDGANLGAEDTTSPYSITWDTTTATNGSHTLTARARDTVVPPFTNTSAGVAVIVDNIPPTVSIAAPTAGILSPGTVAVSANAADTGGSGLVGVQFLLDGANFQAEDTTFPYSITWDTTTTTNANHTLTAVARDGAGNQTTSSLVTVRVNNPVDACSVNAGDSIKINWTSRYSRDCSVYEDLNSNGVYNAGTDTLFWSEGSTTSGTSNRAINGNSSGPIFVSKTYKIDCTGTSSSLTKPSSGTNAWDTGASSVQSVASGDVYTEFSTNENNTYKMGGLGVGDTNQSYTDIDYALYPAIDGNLYLYENGNPRPGTLVNGSWSPYVAGDIFRVAVESGVVRYYKNKVLLYTSSIAPTYPLRFDSSLYTPGATLTDISLTGSPAVGVDFQNIVGVNANSGAGGQTTNVADTLLVTVTAPPPPTVSTATVTVNNSTFCGSGVHATVSATVTSSDASDLTAYEMQIDDDSDPLTGNPEWESGTITGLFPSGSSILRIVESCNPANADATPQTACQMNWNTTYRAWVRVRDRYNQWSSPWTLMSTYCNGASCSAATSWVTPVHAYPDVDPPSGTGGCSPSGYDFSWTPCSPSVGSPVQFTDRTNFAAGSINREWVWSFTGGSPVSSAIQNPLPVTYSAIGSYTVIESVRDDAMPAGAYCTVTKSVSLQQALPRWREVAPR